MTLCLLLAGALPLLGSHAASFYVIPVAAHVNGFGGSVWRTDVAIHNFQTEPITVEMALIETGEGLTDNVGTIEVDDAESFSVAGGATRVLTDVLNGYRGLDSASGAILIGADQPFIVSSRVYSVSADGSTFGQTVTPVEDFVDNSITPGATDAFVPGLTVSGGQRVNLGFLAGASPQSDGPLLVQIVIHSKDGTALGMRTFSIAPGTFTHVQFSAADLVNAPFDSGTAGFHIVSGTGSLTGYASIIDNNTHAGSFINATAPVTVSGQSSTFRSVLAIE